MYIESANTFPYKKAFVVTLGILFLFFLLYGSASAATLGVTANDTTLAPGETATLRLKVNTEGVAINNVEAKLSFPSDVVEVVSTSKASSILSLWVEDVSFSNSAGIITFNGGIPTPGYIGNQGLIVSVVVKAKKAGQAEFIFSNTSVRANDGLGTNVLTSQKGITLSVTQPKPKKKPPIPPPVVEISSKSNENAPVIHSLTHPDQTKWYANSAPKFSWQLPEDVREVRTLIGKLSNATPLVRYDPPIASKQVDALADDTYYFSLQMRDNAGWGTVGRYRVNIDTTAPEPFSVNFVKRTNKWKPPTISFSTDDAVSSVKYYEVKVDDGKPDRIPFADGVVTYAVSVQSPGNHTLLVTAVDEAGNARSASRDFTITGIDAPVITYYSDEVEAGEALEARGTTYPSATVTLAVKDKDEIVFEEEVRSDATGTWALATTKNLPPGIYTFTAYVTDERGARSVETAPLTVEVHPKFITNLMTIVLNYLSVAILILVALLAIGVAALYAWNHTFGAIRHLRRESREAEHVSGKAFKVLREGVNRHITRLKKKRKSKLTKEETEFLEEFSEKLAEADGIISKEIRDISDS